MWTCDKLQWTDKHIQALKLEKIVYNQDFHLFFCKIGLILHNFALRSGNSWLSSDLEQLVLLEYAISSISNQPKSKKSTKSSFLKIGEKWLSLGPRDPMGGRNSQISISTTFFCELNHSESFWAKKKIQKNCRKMTKSGSHCKGKSQKFRKMSSNIDFNHLFSRIEGF